MQARNEDLPAQLVRNLDAAFPSLVHEYQHQLYTFAFRLTGNTHDAEEMTQEAFLHAYYALGNYSEQQVCALNIRPWLYTITRNLFYNTKRKPALPQVPLDDSDDSPLLEIVDEQGPHPEHEAEQEEVRQTWSGFVSQLPDRYREAITLYYFEDFSYYEIAELLHQPVGTVKSNVYRAIRLLRQMAGSLSMRAGDSHGLS